MNIAITGKLGSGKSTIAKIMSETLGYEIYNTGKIQRRTAEEMGISTLELNKRMLTDASLDYIIDEAVAKLSAERDNIIFDSRMAWYFAKNSYRIFLTVDPDVAAQRVFAMNRGKSEKYSSVEEAKRQLIERSEVERKRFRDIYGVDYFDLSNYDLVFDTTYMTSEESAAAIIAEFNKHLMSLSGGDDTLKSQSDKK
ncbi:MAG: AAA family ATPase [Clostridiales bacterium]|nr:AAA family ATPase [Clostridiales bacterium]